MTRLPEGERDENYFMAHIVPKCMELSRKNKAALFAIVTEKFGCKDAPSICPDKWDELIAAIEAEL